MGVSSKAPGAAAGPILVTGFGPFGDVVDNPAASLAQALDGTQVAGVPVRGVVIPVSYGRGPSQAIALGEELGARMVIGLGVAMRRGRVEVEQVGRHRGGPVADVDGRVCAELQPARDVPATIDVPRLAAALDAGVSADAGTYVCNAWLHGVAHALAVPVGFVHLPPEGCGTARFLAGLAALVRGEAEPAPVEPAWALALDALPLMSEAGSPNAPGAPRFGWLLSRGLRGLRLRPMWLGAATEDGRIRVYEATLEELPPGSPPADQRAAALLGGQGSEPWPAQTAAVLDELVGHGGLVGADRQRWSVTRAPLVLDFGPTGEGGVRVCPMLGERALDPAELAALLDGVDRGPRLLHVDAEARQVVVVPIDPATRPVLGWLAGAPWTWPAAEVPSLRQRLPRLGARVELRLHPALSGALVPADPQPVVRLRADGEGGLDIRVGVVPVAGGPVGVPGRGAVQWLATHGGAAVHARRDLAEEVRQARALAAVVPGLPGASRFFVGRVAAPGDALALLDGLTQAGARVVWQGPPSVIRELDEADVAVHLSAQRDWLGLWGEVRVDEHMVSLAAVLAALRVGQRWVPLGTAGWLRLRADLSAELHTLALASEAQGDGDRLPGAAVHLLGGLEAAGAQVEGLAGAGWSLAHAQTAQAFVPPVPEGLQAELRSYQQAGFVWLARLARWAPGACLADEMGLGKTVQALALLLHRAAEGPALVVAPTSLGFNWIREAARFAPGLRFLAYRGADRWAQLAHLGPGVVFVTSYELVVRDTELLAEVPWVTLVLDEAQAIKNPDTQRAQAARRLQTGFCLALTGTPIENRTDELWSILERAVPGLLGPRARFRERFALPIEAHADGDAQARLARLISPFLLRRTKAAVAPELPARLEQVVAVALGQDERALMEATRLAAVADVHAAESDAQRRMAVFAALTRVRQACCHPRLVDPESAVPSSKLAAALSLIQARVHAGEPVVVFSQFVRLLVLMEEALDRAGVAHQRLDGSVPAATRAKLVDRFQAGGVPVFLISLHAGGTGLNLTAAATVVLLDPWWNPAVEDQAADRVHRIGQSRPVQVLRLVAADTIEEQVLAMHADKRALAAGVLSGSGGGALPELAELEAWLSPCGD